FQILAQTSQSRGASHCDAGERRRPGAIRRSSPLLLGKGRAWHRAGTGGIHQLIRELRPDPWPRSLRALAGSWNPASRDPSPSGRALSANGHAEGNFEYVLVWRFGNSRAEATSGFAEQTD